MKQNAMFRGCTRPPMFMGVPYIPFFIGAGSVLLFAMYTGKLLSLFLIPVVLFVMRQMARRDEMIFRLLGLRLRLWLHVKNTREHQSLWVFSPVKLRTPSKR